MGNTQSPPEKPKESEEITETEVVSLLSKSVETIKAYLMAHPGVICKGIPVVVIVWMIYPLLIAAWGWLPWMWASYEVYKILPRGTLSLLTSLFKDNNWLLEILRRPAIQEA